MNSVEPFYDTRRNQMMKGGFDLVKKGYIHWLGQL
jgi:hypothetical protein